MANYVCSTLRVVEGDPQQIFDAVRTDQSVIDFQQLVPMPENIKNSKEKVYWHGIEMYEWEAWAAEHWGTTKNADHVRCGISKWVGLCASVFSGRDPSRQSRPRSKRPRRRSNETYAGSFG